MKTKIAQDFAGCFLSALRLGEMSNANFGVGVRVWNGGGIQMGQWGCWMVCGDDVWLGNGIQSMVNDGWGPPSIQSY
jgi:hypothetical protein